MWKYSCLLCDVYMFSIISCAFWSHKSYWIAVGAEGAWSFHEYFDDPGVSYFSPLPPENNQELNKCTRLSVHSNFCRSVDGDEHQIILFPFSLNECVL